MEYLIFLEKPLEAGSRESRSQSLSLSWQQLIARTVKAAGESL